MRKQFDEQLLKLNDNLKEAANYSKEALDKVTEFFFNKDVRLTEEIFSLTRSIDKKTHKIENLCFLLLLRQQPVAIDLRTITASLKANFDLKRVASQSFDVAEIVKLSTQAERPPISDELLEVLKVMTEQTKKILAQSLSSFFARDPKAAEALIAEDDVVDECFAKTKSLVSGYLIHNDNGDNAVDVLMIAKYFERISDHCINIARWTIKYFY